MNYRQLKDILSCIPDALLDAPVLVTSTDGGVFPVYGHDYFEDCGHHHLGLVVNLDAGEDEVHPLYMKGIVYKTVSDEEVMEYDSLQRSNS